ncbi:MAG TPA: UDP-2,3-diacylglucosamine diphosphatase LpxI [Verrucomicrobiales bacterium]|nr:UDP-2,3-diacylglucosamine diphosphatase LpxI [Verrucomicrobiales bacterium]
MQAGVPDILGLIAGNGAYPFTMAAAARRGGVGRLVAAAFEGETQADLSLKVDEIEWMRVGQLGKMIKFFRRHGVSQAVMVGQIAPKNLFDLRPDFRTLVMLARLKERNAESLFGGIAKELEKDGITLLPATVFLEDDLAREGHMAGPVRKAKEMADIEFGLKIARETSRLDIGQTVVVRRGTVLAVEAFEGTNECIKRGGAMGRGMATVVKVSKPGQDMRFDVPVVGPLTIETAAAAGIRIVAVEAGKTLILEKEEVVRKCQEQGVTLAGV